MSGMNYGAKNWFFPDCYLPEVDEAAVAPSHETISILNPSEESVRLEVAIYFEDRQPIEGLEIEVDGKRDIHVRLDQFEEYTGVEIPRETPYGLAITGEGKVICQHSRLDARNDNLSLFTSMGYRE